MKILISNDDGINARGIAILEEVCSAIADVTVIAPDREQSAASHSLTMFRPLRVEARREGWYQVDGTPTDCVLLGLGDILASRPDFVFSGVNHGSNMGEDVLYSGTVAAAMEGLSLGIPGVAFSLAGREAATLETHRPWLERLVRNILAVTDFPKETLLNVNLPPVPGNAIRGIRVTTLGRVVYSDSLTKMRDPWGRELHWIGGGKTRWTGGHDSDFRAVGDGFISVTPLHVDLTNYQLLETVRSWGLGR